MNNDGIPHHVAIIMDGNGRWAQKRGLPRLLGHRAGAEKVKEIIKAALEKNVQVLTLWAFGTENWNRPTEEVSHLMDLFFRYIKKSVSELNKQNIQFRVIGNKEELDEKLQNVIANAERITAKNTGLKLLLAINYSGRWDIAQAVQKLAKRIETKELSAVDITSKSIAHELCFSDLSDPDLLIRTSGEIRVSNFMLWQLAFTELYFTDVFWPDFGAAEFEKALQAYADRERRFGGIYAFI